jgi:hypothetical protein
MNERKLNQLFTASRKEVPPAPPEDFAGDVLRTLRHESPAASGATSPIFDQLNLLFPRLALVSGVIVLLCVAADYGMTAAGVPDLSDGISQISSQWFLSSGGL